jgi:hypothetical protein
MAESNVGGEPAAITPRYGRWIRGLFWAWQGFYAVLIVWALFGFLVSGPGADSEWLIMPIYLAPVLLPVWVPVTLVLGVLFLLSRSPRPRVRGNGKP